MLWNKLKIGIVALLALGMFGTGAGVARYAVFGAEPKDAKKEKPAQATPAQDLDQVEKLLEQARQILRKQRDQKELNEELQRFREMLLKKEIQAEAERRLLDVEEARRVAQLAQDKIELEKLLKRLEEIVQRQRDQGQIDRIVARLNAIVKKIQAKQDKKSSDKGKDAKTLQQFLGIYQDIDAKSDQDAVQRRIRTLKEGSPIKKDESEAIKLLEEFLKAKENASDEIKRLEKLLKEAEAASDPLQRQQIVDDVNRLIQKTRTERDWPKADKPK